MEYGWRMDRGGEVGNNHNYNHQEGKTPMEMSMPLLLAAIPGIATTLTLMVLFILERKRNVVREKELTDLLVAGTLREYTHCTNAMTPADLLAQTKLEGKVEKEKLEVMRGKGGGGLRVPVT